MAQEFADKEYYLIDSLVLEELSAADSVLIDSCIKVFHQVEDDTNKIQSIEFLVEQCLNDEVWPKYNNWVLNQAKTKLSKNINNPTYFKMLKF